MTIIDNEFQDVSTATGVMRTHLFRPTAAGRYPGLVLYSEIFQVTGPIRRTAALLASHGFIVAVPEIYHEYEAPGTIFAYDTAGAERGNALKTTKPVAAYDADSRRVIELLVQHPLCTGRLGAVGICIGGHLAFRCAMNPEIVATACFYATDIHKQGLGEGMRDDSLSRASTGAIAGELLMIWGRQDPHIPYEGRRKIQDTLEKAGALYTWHEFNGAHAFMRDEGARYNAALAQTCYALVVELFKRRLGDGDRTAAAPPSSESRH
jgi:carboxymethylenebutenolidase